MYTHTWNDNVLVRVLALPTKGERVHYKTNVWQKQQRVWRPVPQINQYSIWHRSPSAFSRSTRIHRQSKQSPSVDSHSHTDRKMRQLSSLTRMECNKHWAKRIRFASNGINPKVHTTLFIDAFGHVRVFVSYWMSPTIVAAHFIKCPPYTNDERVRPKRTAARSFVRSPPRPKTE